MISSTLWQPWLGKSSSGFNYYSDGLQPNSVLSSGELVLTCSNLGGKTHSSDSHVRRERKDPKGIVWRPPTKSRHIAWSLRTGITTQPLTYRIDIEQKNKISSEHVPST